MLKFLALITLLVFTAGFIRTAQLEYSSEQDIFFQGSLPSPMPEGFYHGAVPGHSVSWLGKKFDANSSTGINLFDDNGKAVEKYSFVTSVGTGLHDYGTPVLDIDYNVSSNPLWLRPVLDEVVQTASGQYLGKLEVRIVPYFPFTLTFFTLTK